MTATATKRRARTATDNDGPLAWTGQCTQCGQQFISDTPLPSDAPVVCASCQGATVWQPGPDVSGVYRRPPGKDEYTDVPYEMVVPGRWQYRRTFDQAELEELAASIAVEGLINRPILFCNEDHLWELIAGERRWRAWQLLATGTLQREGLSYDPAAFQRLPVRLVEGDARALQVMTLVDNLQRANPDPVDEGLAFERLVKDLKVSEAELSRMTGKARSYIQQRRGIAGAAPEVQEALATGAITFSIARALATGAPGDTKSQGKALKELQKRLERGSRVSEKDAAEQVEREVFAAIPKKLEALGWKTEKTWQGLLVWSHTERPRFWKGVEALEVVRAKRSPEPVPLIDALHPPQQASAEARETLAQRYTIGRVGDWYALQENYSDPKRYYNAAEAEDMAAAWAMQLAGVRSRLEEAGWKLERAGGSGYAIVSPKGNRTYLSSWDEVSHLADAVDAGTAHDPDPKQQGRKGAQPKCVGCKKSVDYLQRHQGRDLCEACIRAAQEQEKRDQEALHARLAERYGDWVATTPPEVMRLWATLFANTRTLVRSYDEPAVRREKVAGLDEPTLRACALDMLMTAAWHQREHLAAFGITLPPGGSKAKEVAGD